MTISITADRYLGKALRALDEARVLLREAKTEGTCNRAYYAMHDAAHAVRLAHGVELASAAMIKTHHGLVAAFGRQLVQTGLLGTDLGRDLKPDANDQACRRLFLRAATT